MCINLGEGKILKTLYLLIVLLITVILLSCQLEGDKLMKLDENFQYPLEVGNQWEYSTQIEFFNPRPDSVLSVIPETSISGQSIVTISKQQMLDNSVNSYCFRQRLKQGTEPEFYSESYYANQPDGLYLYAYRGSGMSMPRLAGGKILFKNRRYKDIRELLKQLTDSHYFVPLSANDFLNYEHPPLCVISYPFKIGSEWLYRSYNNPFLIVKRIDDSKVMETAAGTFFTYRVQWLYHMDSNGELDNDIHLADYYSGIGLVKRSIRIQNLMITTEESPQEIGLVDYSEEYELIDYQVK